jgi:GDP-L-fucose synthase
MIDLKDKKVALTGPTSMLGRAVWKKLVGRGALVYPIEHARYNLMAYADARTAFEDQDFDFCVHAAGYNGGIAFNKNYPAAIFQTNAFMALNVLNCCHRFGVKKVVSILPSCAYAENADGILREEDFTKGPCHESVECHGLAKRVLFDYGRLLFRQYGFLSVCAIPNTCYGPFDRFDPERSKVVAGLLLKFHESARACHREITCWGSGTALREFIYCEDAAEGVLRTLERYEDPTLPINIATDREDRVRYLAGLCATVTDFAGEIYWDRSKPDGAKRKFLCPDRCRKYLDFRPTWTLEEGLKETYLWFRQNRSAATAAA